MNFTLFKTMFKISACTFGGGFVIVSLMNTIFVQQLQLLEEEEMMNFIAIAQATPGAIPVNAALLVGYRINKKQGALCALLGTILPPLLIIGSIALGYEAFQNNPYIMTLLQGMQIGVAIIMIDIFIRTIRPYVIKKQYFALAIFVIAFSLQKLFHFPILLTIFLCGSLGALHQWFQIQKEEAWNY